ncbi:hypothetical protein K456DRAFT_1385379 [Colletotrichum gloeosporioides 23]|nr:hypothetical protein K456DRAFT_1385379 [Colletotrichum gloeosporioides 23]
MTERDEVGRPFWRGEGLGWMHIHVRECGLSTPIRVLSLYLPPPTPAGPVSSGSVFLELGPASRKLSESTGTTGHQEGGGGGGGTRGGDEMLLAAGGGQAGVMEGKCMVWRWSSSIRKKKPRFGSANELGESDRPSPSQDRTSPSQDRISEVEVVFRGCKVEKEKRVKRNCRSALQPAPSRWQRCHG